MYYRKLSRASPKDSDLASSTKTEDKEESNTPLKKKQNSSQHMEVESPSRLIKQSNSLMHTHTHTHTQTELTMLLTIIFINKSTEERRKGQLQELASSGV